MILTRFNLPTPGVESIVRARDGWLRERVELFVRYCIPSVDNQIGGPVEWLVYFDPESPRWLIDRITPFVERGLFHPVYRSTVRPEQVVADISQAITRQGDVLLTTNLDNDDALAVDACHRLARVDAREPRSALYMSRGLIKSAHGVYLRRDRRNAFVSVRESWSSPVTSWAEYHNEFSRVMPTVELSGRPGWLQVVHGSNVSNRVRGRLVSPAAYQDLFGSMLDDVEEPSLVDQGRDRLLRAPVRTLRDSGRAMARRSALALLGKERYGQAKLRLAGIRREG